MPENRAGKVHLVGAGPGDPGLLTLRAATLLDAADLVVYDALVNPKILEHVPDSKKIYAGKRGGQESTSQGYINQLLIEKAREGKIVVRLKGGDPFVFGRGGEEAIALANAGIAFEVVPGVTAAVAVAAYAGIPVTHRDFNSSFTLLTGHEKDVDGRHDTDLDWTVLAKLPCLAFYMGLKSLPAICEKLIAGGADPQTPAATISHGTTPAQRTVVGTLATLPALALDAKLQPPSLTIVGPVVTMHHTLNWFESRPLFGRTVIVTRTRQQASELSEKLMNLGANVIEAPTIEIAPPADTTTIDDAIRAAAEFDWVIFTSPAGARATRERLDALDLDVRVFGDARVAAIGDATAAAIRRELALRVDLSPVHFVAESLAAGLIDRDEARGKRFLLLRADISRPLLPQTLLAAGAAEIRDVAVYETRAAAALPATVLSAIEAKSVDWITFTSSSTATNFAKLLGDDYREKLSNVKIASIGPITTTTLRELSLEPTVQAETFNIAGLVEALTPSPGSPGEGRGEGSSPPAIGSDPCGEASPTQQNPHPNPLPDYRARE